MTSEFGRRFKAYENEFKQSFGQLLGIATGLLADRELVDKEVHFLNEWLTCHEEIASAWPGDVVHRRIREVLVDGRISDEERAHLIDTLTELVGGRLDELAGTRHVSALMFDAVKSVKFSGSMFCLTGDFVYAPRTICEGAIVSRGGQVGRGITRKVQYLVVGGLGSVEWKHGSFGTKVEKAMDYKRSGVPISIIHEDIWAAHL